MILASHGIIASSSGITFDADALSFITAAAITDSTQQTAINTLVTDLKGYNIWTKMKALYPFVGGSASSHKWNLKDPRDLDAAYRLVFSGGWTHDSNGILGNGANTFAYTNLNPYIDLTNNDNHLSIYSNLNRTDGGASTDKGLIAGALDGGYSLRFALAVSNDDSSTSFADTTTSTITAITESTKLGYYIGTRTSSTSLKLFKNGSSVATNTGTNSTNLPNYQYYLGAWNVGGTARSAYRRLAGATVGSGLNDTESTNLSAAMHSFNTTLGRQY